ncbi:hypothetical protein PROFUN_02680 [Planoprotostelium fungivorum]|uniref:Cytochrome b5 heme-binding domain-containing protein n=1 Tax=Planoprotostelium fungivorum TaxID=1890364 RepID=A0A2P6NVG0_9EUKA|nr:hypothetical protein PROFUN_02680 [Planoprotostelium fungivorum]
MQTQQAETNLNTSRTIKKSKKMHPQPRQMQVDIEDIIQRSEGIHNICTCKQSSSYPKCDGSHEVFNRETKSSLRPLVVKISRATASTETETQTENSQQATTLSSASPKSNVQYVDGSTQTEEEETTTISETVRKDMSLVSGNHKSRRKIVAVDPKAITAEWTLEQIATHNTEDDCWLIVNNGVYDITAYFDYHPGGKKALVKFGGRDASENVQFHSDKMLFLLNKYFYVGRVQGTKDNACVIL